jgi:solute carrier family 8 (sodium/calcium exchanger)
MVLELTTTIGCLLDARSAVQALVLVAIGFSLPECTASKRAAESKRTKDADASIATTAGTNAASVFIGLGLPWTIATIYHWAKYGESFFVGKLPTADITFALVLFLATSVICFMVLGLRRLIIGGELGGPGVSRIFSAIVMFFLWGAFITLNIMNCYGYLGARDIFVPAVAINANQHLTSDWVAPIVEPVQIPLF